MRKQEFLTALQTRLSGLPQEDVEERVSFYGEMIDDRVEEGLSEEDAVTAIGPIDAIAEQTLSEIPLTKLVREKVRPATHQTAAASALPQARSDTPSQLRRCLHPALP